LNLRQTQNIKKKEREGVSEEGEKGLQRGNTASEPKEEKNLQG